MRMQGKGMWGLRGCTQRKRGWYRLLQRIKGRVASSATRSGVERLLEVDRRHPRNGFGATTALDVEDRASIAGDPNDSCVGHCVSEEPRPVGKGRTVVGAEKARRRGFRNATGDGGEAKNGVEVNGTANVRWVDRLLEEDENVCAEERNLAERGWSAAASREGGRREHAQESAALLPCGESGSEGPWTAPCR